MNCSQCKFYKDVIHGFGDPTGKCLLIEKYIKENKIKNYDIWSVSTGTYANCKLNIDEIIKEKK